LELTAVDKLLDGKLLLELDETYKLDEDEAEVCISVVTCAGTAANDKLFELVDILLLELKDALELVDTAVCAATVIIVGAEGAFDIIFASC